VLLVDDDQPEALDRQRRPPSAGRRTRAPRRGAAAANSSKRSPSDAGGAGTATGVAEALGRSAPRSARQADLGHQDDRASPRRSGRRRPRAGRPRFLPEPVTPCSSRRSPGPTPRPASSTSRCAAVSAQAAKAATPPPPRARRAPLNARPRRAPPPPLEPAQRGEVAPGRARQRRQQRAGRRFRGRSPSSGLLGALAPQRRALPHPRRAGGRAAARAAKVEQYSRAIHRASSTRSAGTECGRTSRAAASRSGAIAEESARPTTTP